MSVSTISTSTATQQLASTTPQGARGGAMKSLVDNIGNGDMTGAKAAFDAMQKNRKDAGATASTGTGQRSQDIAALGKAIDSGDADAARQALAKLRDDGKNAAGNADGAKSAQGAHHHHHGHRTQASGAASGGTQGTSLTYTASASGTQTAAPGSTIDVSA
jgi:hypothetical protein